MTFAIPKLAAFALLLGGAAHAATFAEIDTNADDGIDATEYAAAFGSAGSFSWADVDGDGFLSRAEIQTASGAGDMTFDDIDLDNDGTLELEEMSYHFGPSAQIALAKFDENGDGIVTLDEVRRSDNPKGERSRPRMARAAEDGTALDGGSNRNSRSGGGNGRGNGGRNGNGGGNGGGNGKNR